MSLIFTRLAVLIAASFVFGFNGVIIMDFILKIIIFRCLLHFFFAICKLFCISLFLGIEMMKKVELSIYQDDTWDCCAFRWMWEREKYMQRVLNV